MRVSLLISTYERPAALAAVLRSVKRQTHPPFEVIVGDDGSGPETAEVIQAALANGPHIRHFWREHDGFRLARSRNSTLAAATGDYVVFIDDDILLHPDFVADHVFAARQGFFMQGSRVILDETASRAALAEELYWPSFFSSGIGNRKNLIRSRLLSLLFAGEVGGLRGIRTCNFAAWREDCYRVNGFNEDFVGWGREDSEFVVRMMNSGVKRKNLKFAALGCHIHHPPRSREGLNRNDHLLDNTIAQRLTRCEHGLDFHGDKAWEGMNGQN